MNAKTNTRFPAFFMAIVVAVFGILFLPTWLEALNDHALVGHGDDAVAAAKCLDGEGTPAGTFENKTAYDPARTAYICYDPKSGKWYVIFAAVTAVVTAYCVERAKRKGDMINYLKARGFK